MSRFRPIRILGPLLALGLALTLSAGGWVPAGASGTGGPTSLAAALTDGPAFAVGLAASSASVAPGGTTTLTATSSRDVATTPFYIEIFDLTARTLLAACSSGTTCTARVTVLGSAVRSYAAYISSFGSAFPPQSIQASSSSVYVSWLSVTLTANPAQLRPGGASLVTANASLDVGPTPFYVEVFDQGSGALLAVCGSGSSCSASVSQPVVTERSYVAFVSGFGSALPPPDTRAISNTVLVDWVATLPSAVAVPDLFGDTPDQAIAELQAVGLVLGSSTTDVNCDSLGLVDRQSPTAGTQVASGSAVSITTGTEPDPPAVCR
jgi:PASTA domain